MNGRASTAKKVREAKERHPELYCPEKDCLWRTGGGYCPRHRQEGPYYDAMNKPCPEYFGTHPCFFTEGP